MIISINNIIFVMYVFDSSVKDANFITNTTNNR